MPRRILLYLLVAAVLVLCAGAASAALPEGWQVVESSAQRLVLRIEVPEVVLSTVEGEGTLYLSPHLAGYWRLGSPGLPLLPQRGAWIAIPPSGDCSLTVKVLSTRVLPSGRILPHPTPVQPPLGAHEPLDSAPEELVEAEGYASFSLGHEQIARLGSPVWSSKQRLIPLTVQPFLVSGAGARFEQVTELELVIEFPRSTDLGSAPGRPDARTLARVLNPEIAAQWRAYSPEQRLRMESSRLPRSSSWSGKAADSILPVDQLQLLSDEYRIPVPATGLTRLHMSDLFGALGFPTGIRRDQLRLYQKRPSDPGSAEYPTPLSVDVPFHFLNNPDPAGELASNDILLFYGFNAHVDNRARDVGGQSFPAAMEHRADNYNAYNMYWLAAADPAGGAWARMPVESFAAAAGAPRQYYDYEEIFGKDVFYQDNPVDVLETRYQWNTAFEVEGRLPLRLRPMDPSSPIEVQWTFCSTIHSRQPAALLRSFFLERDDASGRTLLGTFDINGGQGSYDPGPYGAPTAVLDTVAAGIFDEGSLRLRFHDANEASTSFHLVMVDSVTLRYRAAYAADFDRADFNTGVGGQEVSLEIPGFTSAQLFVFEITDPRAPRWVELAPENWLPDGGGRTMSLEVPADGLETRRFFADAAVSISRVTPEDISRSRTPILTDALSPLQVIAMGPAEFRDATQGWLQWRRDHDREGWNYDYVDVQDIFDQFSGGLRSPHAIKEFCRYANTLWDAKAILLVGDSNEDHRQVRRVANQPAGTKDFVPSSVHLQVYDDYEVLASDKWYVMFDIIEDNYPRRLTKGPDMLIGRWPVRTANDVAALVAKLRAYEQPTLNDSWRKTVLMVSDDAFSTGYLGGAGGGRYLFYSQEAGFENSQDNFSARTTAFLDGVMEGQSWALDFFTAPVRGEGTSFPLSMLGVVIQDVGANTRPKFYSTMQQGAFLLSYQGHANFNVLGHEQLMIHIGGGADPIDPIGNDGKPFVFYGMGCHVSDFIRPTEMAPNDVRSLGESFMMHPTGGAIVSYGSSGFEFLSPNLAFGDVITEAFFGGTRSGQILGASSAQWILGDVMAQSEWDVFAAPTVFIPEMVSQYTLLGDPLLRMDGDAPRVGARADGVDIVDGGEVLPATGNSISLSVDAVDESGVDRVELIQILDGQESDLSSLLTPETGPGLDSRTWRVSGDLPVNASGLGGGTDYELRVYDLAYPDLRPRLFHFRVPFDLVVTIDGTELTPEGHVVPPGETVAFELQFSSPVALTEDEIEVELTGLSFDGALDKTMEDTGGREWTVSFDATGEVAEEQNILLRLAGSETLIPLAGQVADEPLAILAHYPIPSPANPERGPIRIVVDLSVPTAERARVTVYDLSGRPVKSWTENGLQGEAPLVLTWDGRDRRGDQLANGTYLYRLEVYGRGDEKHGAEMGRVVLMR